MIASIWKIEFITASGTFLLLDWGDFIAAEIGPKVSQEAESFAPIGADWGRSRPQGGAQTSLSWTVRRDHASHADLRAACMRHAAAFPSGQSGIIRMSIQNGEVWEIESAALTASEPLPLVPSAEFRTVTSYNAQGGRLKPGEPIALYPGIPWSWILQDWDSITTDWDSL